jgi:hypothetical protein
MTFRIPASTAALLAGLLFSGCAGENSDGLFTTGALGTSPAATAAAEPKTDPVCATLASSIEGMRKEGIADKIEKAAAKKYKMTTADLKKADQLTKASADFQMRCSTVKPGTAQTPATPKAPAKS